MESSNRAEISVEKKITIHRSEHALYLLLRNQEHYPFFLSFIENVVMLDEKHFQWYMHLSDNEQVISTTEIVHENPYHRFAWHSEQSSELLHEGSVVLIKKAHAVTELIFSIRIYLPPMYDTTALINEATLIAFISDGLERLKLAVEANQFPLKQEIRPQNPEEPPGHLKKHFPLDE